MPRISFSNQWPDKTVMLWVEPWCADYWMRDRDEFTVEFDDADFWAGVIREGRDFEVNWTEEGLTVWVAARKYTVRDQAGNELEHGHQRPEGVAQP